MRCFLITIGSLLTIGTVCNIDHLPISSVIINLTLGIGMFYLGYRMFPNNAINVVKRKKAEQEFFSAEKEFLEAEKQYLKNNK